MDVYSCHVTPLPVNIKEYELLSIFREYDDLCGIFIARPKEKENFSYTYGFLRFKSKKSADHAIQNSTKKLNGWPLVIKHAKRTEHLTVKTDKPNFGSARPVLDADFYKVFQEFGQKDCNSRSLDLVLKSIEVRRPASFQPQRPTCALSVDITETFTQNLDYKFWRTFFRDQNDISNCLTEIFRKQGSPDTFKHDSEQSNSVSKEMFFKKEASDNRKEIDSQKPLPCLANKEEESRSSWALTQISKSDPEAGEQGGFSFQEDLHSNYQKKKQNCEREDQEFELCQKEPQENRTLLTEEKKHNGMVSLQKYYPIGRGRGLGFVHQNMNLPIQDQSLIGFYKNSSCLGNKH